MESTLSESLEMPTTPSEIQKKPMKTRRPSTKKSERTPEEIAYLERRKANYHKKKERLQEQLVEYRKQYYREHKEYFYRKNREHTKARAALIKELLSKYA